MAEDKKEPWLNYLALTTVLFAVCATLSTFKGGGYSTKSVLAQAQASDQWAYFQAKSVKSNLYELQKENLEMELKESRAHSQEAADIYSQKIAAYAERIERYSKEKAAIEAEAKKLEASRNDAQTHSKMFGLSVIFLQLAILLSSIAALLKKKPIWYCGLLLGAAGLFVFANGFLLLIA